LELGEVYLNKVSEIETQRADVKLALSVLMFIINLIGASYSVIIITKK